MITELKQRRWWIRKHLTLQEEGVHYYSVDHEVRANFLVPYKDISSRDSCFVRTEYYPRIFHAGLFFSAVAILRSSVIYTDNLRFMTGVGVGILIALFSFLLYRLIRSRYFCVAIDGGPAMFLLLNEPGEKTVEEFVDSLFEARKACYRKEYFFIDYRGKRREELNRMQWLRSEGVISENEYLVVVDEINENLQD